MTESVRLLHMTDVHFFRPGPLGGMLGKRALGLANLYIKGRRRYFAADALVPLAVQDALGQGLDLFCMTGDVTALSSQAEFEAGRQAFAPLLDGYPSVVIPGNHDTYTRGAVRDARMEKTFAAFMAGGSWDPTKGAWVGGASLGARGVPWPTRFRFRHVDLIATNPCRPGLAASGRFEPGAIEAAEALVRESRAAGQVVVYLLHYPVLEPGGAPYDHDGHALTDVHELIASLRRAPPHLVLHGHEHRAYRESLIAEDGSEVVVLGCGTTSARSPLPDRSAGYFLVDLDPTGVRGVTRRWLGEGGFAVDPSLTAPS